jgi:hypothetical protein
MGRQLHGVIVAGVFVLNAPLAANAQSNSTFGSALEDGRRSPWRFQVSGLVSHFKDPECDDCTYRTTVPGIGLRRDFSPANAPIGYGLSAGLQTDSFGGSGGYAAATASIDVPAASLVFKPGLGAFAFYRYMDYGAARQATGRDIVPALLPMLSVEEVRSGIGATLLVAPNFSYAGRDRSGFVFLQLTFRLGRDGAPPTRVAPAGAGAGPIAATEPPEFRSHH